MIKIIIFILPCILVIVGNLKKIFISKSTILKKRERMKKIGIRMQYLITSIPSLIASVCYLASVKYIQYYSIPWIIIALITIISVIFITLFKPADDIGRVVLYQMEDKDVKNLAPIYKKEKKRAILSLMALILWIFSWHSVFF